MKIENRKNTRYPEIGHILAPELCTLPGIIDDVSITGCKVHYQFPVVADLEMEYEAKLSPSKNPFTNPLNLVIKPQWVKESDSKTYIGFQIQFSPDANKLAEFINHLKHLSDEENEESEII